MLTFLVKTHCLIAGFTALGLSSTVITAHVAYWLVAKRFIVVSSLFVLYLDANAVHSFASASPLSEHSMDSRRQLFDNVQICGA